MGLKKLSLLGRLEMNDHIPRDDRYVEVMYVPGIVGAQAENDPGLPKGESEEDFIWHLAYSALCY